VENSRTIRVSQNAVSKERKWQNQKVKWSHMKGVFSKS